MRTLLALPLLVMLPKQAMAQDGIETFVKVDAARGEDGAIAVELRFLNGGEQPGTLDLPDRVLARLDTDGVASLIWLERSGASPRTITIASHGFAQARYRLVGPAPGAHALLSIPAWHTQSIALASAPAEPSAPQAPSVPVADAGLPPAPPSDRNAGNAFINSMSAYEPIYAVYGPGTNTDARIQVSFKFRLFGSHRSADLTHPWRDGLHFAYTQRMFWDLGAYSSPFRNIDFRPELIYIMPSATLNDRLSVSAQLGFQHESNGRDGLQSRSINNLYIAPMAAVRLGGGYRLVAAPRLSLYVGDKSDNPDIIHYRGISSLYLEIGKDDGLRLTADSRLNLGSGKGAISANLSYPLPRLLGGGPNVYLFGQAFAGYGENLLDYNRHMTRARIGFAIVR